MLPANEYMVEKHCRCQAFSPTIRPLLNTMTPTYIFLFQPLVEGYVGYFLIGNILGTKTHHRATRLTIYAGGVLGLLIGVIGNQLASTADNINFPFNGGYSINHYLCAAAIFVGAKTLCERSSLSVLTPIAAKLALLVFGVYWIHVEILTVFQQIATPIASVPLYAYLSLEYFFATVCSFGIVWVLSKVTLLRKFLL